jgi:hypothetical protein
MSDLVIRNYLEISPNMPLAAIAQIEDLPRRALALFYTKALDPGNPAAVQLAESVDVPEAGAWGINVAARMASLKAKPPVSRPKSKRFSMPLELRPNLFIAFDNEVAKLNAISELAGHKDAENVSYAGQCHDARYENASKVPSLGREEV